MDGIRINRIAADEDRDLPMFGELDRLIEEVRKEAFLLFAGRGYGVGQALEDWFAAEKIVFGRDTELRASEDSYELRAALPGFEPAEVTVTATPCELIVMAEAAGAGTEGAPGREAPETTVYRRVTLPRAIEVDRVSASMKSGVLTVVAPTVEGSEAAEVPVAA